MKIWIINEYAGSPYHGMTYRHYYMSRVLVDRGNDVTIISGAYSHHLRVLPKTKGKYTIERIDGISYVWIRTVRYRDAHGKGRVLKWFDFAVSLMFLPTRRLSKPDVVLCSPTAPVCVLPARRIARRYDAQFIFEVRDIWPLTLIELGGYSRRHPFIRLLGWLEKYAIRKSDVTVSVMADYARHVRDLGIEKQRIEYVPNGIHLGEAERSEPLSDDVLRQIPEGKFIIGYTGSIGYANAVETLVYAAEILHRRSLQDIAVVIVGQGKERDTLVEYVRQKGLHNVVFIDAIPKQQVQSLLERFDACYIGLKDKKLFHFGVSPNKLFGYMYSGRPIVYSIGGGNSLVRMSGCGIEVPAEDPAGVSKAIVSLRNMAKAERDELGRRGKEFVIKNHSYDALVDKLIAIMNRN